MYKGQVLSPVCPLRDRLAREAFHMDTHFHPKTSNGPGVREVWDNPDLLILSRWQIDSIISNAYWDAWNHTGDEWRLYPVLSIPFTLASATMEVRFPHAAIVTIPQAVFDPSAKYRRQGVNASSAATHGSRSSRSALTGHPAEVRAPVPGTAHIRLEHLRRSESPSPASHAGQPSTGTQIATSSEREVPAASNNSQAAIPTKIPDLARIIRYNKNVKIPADVGDMPYDQHVDAVEQKPLFHAGQWNTPEAAEAAEALLEDHMNQVYDTAMAAFATHPEWKTFTIQLVIGIFFSQLEWTREDTSNPQAEYEAVVRERMQGSESSEVFPGLGLKHRPPITPNPTVPPIAVPGTPTAERVAPLLPVTPIPLPLLSPFTPSLKKLTISQKNDAVLRKELNRMLKTARTRSNPKVYYWNEPALEFVEDDIYGTKCSLSPKFIEAISSPLWDRDVDFQPSWLNCPTGTREPLTQGPHVRTLAGALQKKIEKHVQEIRHALSEEFGIPDGDDEADEDYTPDEPRDKRPKPARTRTHADQEIMTGVGSQPLDRQQRKAKVAGDQKRRADEVAGRKKKAESKGASEYWTGFADTDANDKDT